MSKGHSKRTKRPTKRETERQRQRETETERDCGEGTETVSHAHTREDVETE